MTTMPDACRAVCRFWGTSRLKHFNKNLPSLSMLEPRKSWLAPQAFDEVPRKILLVTSAKLVVTSALLVVTESYSN